VQRRLGPLRRGQQRPPLERGKHPQYRAEEAAAIEGWRRASSVVRCIRPSLESVGRQLGSLPQRAQVDGLCLCHRVRACPGATSLPVPCARPAHLRLSHHWPLGTCSPSVHGVDPARILLATPVFRGLTADDVADLVPHLRQRQFARGDTVWLEGDAADALYVVATGQLKSYRVSKDGTEVIVRLHPEGDVTGEVGLFHPSGVRQVSVSAMVPTCCLTLTREPLLEALTRHPRAMRQMLEQLSTVAVVSAHAFTAVAFDDIRTRVASTLLTLAKEFGEPLRNDGVRIRLRLSQTTLAALVAASRENVNRALSTFLAEGVVSQADGHFLLHDLEALGQAASV